MHIYWRTHYHLIWATKDRLPLITPDRETLLYPYIHGKADALGGIVQAIGGIADHIHLVVSIPPTIAVTDFIKHIKGSSSHHLNQHPMPNSPTFAWQRGYGVITLGSKQCDRAIAYVHNQKHHHQTHTTIAALELTQPKPSPNHHTLSTTHPGSNYHSHPADSTSTQTPTTPAP